MFIFLSKFLPIHFLYFCLTGLFKDIILQRFKILSGKKETLSVKKT